MPRKLAWDRSLFTVTVFLVMAGLLMVYSASAVLAMDLYGSPYTFLVKQALFAVVGFALMACLMNVPYRLLNQRGVVYGYLAANLLLLVVVLMTAPQNHAHRWLRLGPISFQPSELSKISIAIFMAYQLAQKKDRVNDFFTTLFPCLLVLGQTAFLVVIEPDLGTAVSLVAIAGAMLFVAGLRMSYVAGLAAAFCPAFYIAVVRVPYRMRRIMTFLDPWNDPLGSGFQAIQSLIAVGTGGVWGLGPGEGKQKLFFLPEPHTDFIFAVFAEEFGLIGGCALIFLYTIYMWRGLRASMRVPDNFGQLLAVGLTTMIVFQAFVNIGVVIGVFPTKGLPLPFISAGGSSLVVCMAASGILLNISREAG
ncbi:MAG: putative lipid II flippase FtsW [Acidobacteriota bacterium]